jgi:hypothetical protein
MSDEKKKPKPDLDLDDLGVVVDDLPPLDGDAVDEADPAVLADYLAELDDGDPEAGDEPSSGDGFDDEIADDLSHLEGSWVDDDVEPAQEDLPVEVGEEETGWTEEGADETPTLEDDWFVDESDTVVPDDGGLEGPIGDDLTEIDSSTWDDLGDDSEDDDEPVEDVMDRLGIAFPEEEGVDRARGRKPRVDRGLVLERQFLGPVDERVEAVAVDGGAVVGAGEGIFVLGADGMLHRTPVEIAGRCRTVCVFGQHTFVGTDSAGAYRLSERERSAVAINGWNSIWIDERAVMGRVTTTFDIVDQPLGDELRVLGWTGEGQLFASTDLGQTWSGPLTEGKCLGAAVDEVAGEVVALVRVAGSGSRLMASRDLETWRGLTTPEPLAGVDQPGSFALAAAEGTLLAAVDAPGSPLLCSFDSGASWSERPEVVGVTALAVDPGGPGRIAVAVHDPDEDMGLVRVSEDGGKSWRTAAVTGSERRARTRSAADGFLGRVTCLLVDVGRTRRLFVVAGEGVQRIVLARGGLTQ